MLILKWWFIKWIFNDMAFYHHVLIWAFWVSKRFKRDGCTYIKYHIYILLYIYIYIQISYHYFGHWCYCSIFLLVVIRPSPDPPLDETTRSGRSRDFRPLQSNPWCRHCLCNAYLRQNPRSVMKFLKVSFFWLVYPCISHVWLVYIPSIAGNSWHISYVNVWLASSQLAEIHSSRDCPIVPRPKRWLCFERFSGNWTGAIQKTKRKWPLSTCENDDWLEFWLWKWWLTNEWNRVMDWGVPNW